MMTSSLALQYMIVQRKRQIMGSIGLNLFKGLGLQVKRLLLICSEGLDGPGQVGDTTNQTIHLIVSLQGIDFQPARHRPPLIKPKNPPSSQKRRLL